VGDVAADRILGGLEERLASWKPGPAPGFEPVSVPEPAPARETVVMPDKASADVVMIEPSTLTRLDPAYLACTLANSALGQSSLTSRLGVRVRDTEGLTYGIHSSFHATHIPGPFAVTVTVKPESRDAAVASTLDEITKFLRTGLTPREIEEEKSSRIGKFQVDLASNGGIAQALDAAVYYGLGVEYLDRFPSLVESITRDEADAAFRERVHPDRFTIASAGSF
jgi:zinc protease